MSQTPYATGAFDEAMAEGATFFEATGGDWSDIAEEAARIADERLLVNMGPQHPSTHGVLRLMLELDGETVRETRAGVGFLHSGIEKNMEYRTYTQGVTFCTRMDYVAPFLNEAPYVLAIEKLLGITDEIPERATVIRVLFMELCRIASHFVAIGTAGNELGATTIMIAGFNGREEILRVFEAVSGVRMNHGYFRPGGVATDLPEGFETYIRERIPGIRKYIGELGDLMLANPILQGRMKGIAYLSLAACMALGITGPILRSTGLPYDIRRAFPYCGYETYDFDIPVTHNADSWDRLVIRFEEMYQSLRIVDQALDRLEAMGPGPVMVADKKIAWPAQLSVGADGQGNSPDYVNHIMGTSMEALIHHFKMVAEGFRVPPGQVWQMVEHAKGMIGVHLVSDGGTRPYRVHFRDPSYNNLQALSLMTEGGQVGDVVIAMAGIDPVLGGVDR